MAVKRKRSTRTAAQSASRSLWQGGRKARADREGKREAVIRAAAIAFRKRGFHNTSLDEIASALRVTKPTLYYYVQNKEGLLFECFLAGLEPIRAAVREAVAGEGPALVRLRRVLVDYAIAIASDFGWCMVQAEDQDLGDALRAQVRGLKSEIDQGIRRLLRAGMADGSIADVDPRMASFALAGALNWIAHWYREDRSLGPEQVAELFAGLFERGLAPRRPRT